MAKTDNVLKALESGGNVLDFSLEPYDFMNKGQNISDIVRKALSELSTMITYKGAEDIKTLNMERGELYTLKYAACVSEVKGDLYITPANLAGEPDPYYIPSECVVTIPALGYSETKTIGKDCAVIWNDAMHIGVMPTLQKWASIMVEVELTLLNKLYEERASMLINAADPKTEQAVRIYLEKQKRGERSAVVSSTLRESLKVSPYANKTDSFKDLIELEQYLWARLWQSFGLQVGGYNLKSQYVNEAETEMGLGVDLLAPPASDILRQRHKGWDMANKLFGIHLEPVLGSSWKIRNDKNNNGIEDSIEGQTEEEETDEGQAIEEKKEDEEDVRDKEN